VQSTVFKIYMYQIPHSLSRQTFAKTDSVRIDKRRQHRCLMVISLDKFTCLLHRSTISMTCWGTTATTLVPRLWIGERPRPRERSRG